MAQFNQPLAGKIEPSQDLAWRKAAPRDRQKFYEEAGRLALVEKRKELLRAIGANGRKMAPRKRPRRDGANGPVMDPHDETSRTYRLLDARTWVGGVTLYWHAAARTKGQSKPWATILGYHADGKVRGAPKRDVRLSTRGITSVRKSMAAWWAQRVEAAEKLARAQAAVEPAKPKSLVAKAKATLFKANKVKAPKHVPAPGSNRPLTPEQEAMARRHPSLRAYLRNPEEDF